MAFSSCRTTPIRGFGLRSSRGGPVILVDTDRPAAQSSCKHLGYRLAKILATLTSEAWCDSHCSRTGSFSVLQAKIDAWTRSVMRDGGYSFLRLGEV